MKYSCCKLMVPVLMAVTLVLTDVISVTTAMAGDKAGSFMSRVRLIGVLPDDSSSAITTIGGNAEVDGTVSLDLDFTYFITDTIAAELTLALTKNDVDAVNTAAGNLDLGNVWLLPPTLTVQYHFMPEGTFRPYIGAGINYTIFFDGDSGNANDLDYDNSFGWALQAGCDIIINDNWALNLDVKKIWLDTDVTVRALGTTVYADVDIDPWLVGVGVAYRF